MKSEVYDSEPKPSRWQRAIRLFAVRGFLLCLTLFLIEVGIFFAVTSFPYFPGEQSLYTGQAHQLSSQVSNSTSLQLFSEIFTNNLRIALIEMIPFLGILFFAVSMYATARVTQAIAGIQGAPVSVVVLLLLVVFPHSLIELPAYAVAAAEGLYVTYAILTWRLASEWLQILINILIVTVMLVVAAVFETVEIALGSYFWITWVPFIGLVFVVLWLNKRLSRIRRGQEPKTLPPPAAPLARQQSRE